MKTKKEIRNTLHKQNIDKKLSDENLYGLISWKMQTKVQVMIN